MRHSVTGPLHAQSWLLRLRPVLRPRHRLVCLPHAGGGTLAYRDWGRQLPADIEVVAVQLPGRECRINETPANDFNVLAQSVAANLAATANGISTVLFGHSFGGLLAYEACLRLPPSAQPDHVIVSGARAPHLRPVAVSIAHLARAEFLREVSGLAGMSDEILEHPDLVDVLLPALRADFRLAENYLAPAPPRRLESSLTVFGGTDDPGVPQHLLNGWCDCTRGRFRVRMFPGGHFFTMSQETAVLAAIRDEIDGATLGRG